MYLSKNPTTAADVYIFLRLEGNVDHCNNIMHLFKIALLIPPSTPNVERGFSVMNLLCSPLRSSLSEKSLDRLMRMCLNGPDKLSEYDLEELCESFKSNRGNKALRVVII